MAGEERDLTNRDDSRPVRVKVDNVKKIYNTRNGEMVALNGVTLDIHDNEFMELKPCISWIYHWFRTRDCTWYFNGLVQTNVCTVPSNL